MSDYLELVSVFQDLPKLPSGQSTRPPCAVVRSTLSGRGSNLSPGVFAYQRIINVISVTFQGGLMHSTDLIDVQSASNCQV